MGQDKQGNCIYFMGLWYQREKLVHTIMTLLDLAGIETSEYIFQDVFPIINFSTKCGGALSKRLHLTNIGCRISIWGIQRRYYEFVALVEKLKMQVE